ncbi:maleylpyruvate isomerase family mycothiol-dependent enzyme [Modestobacter marinus]|uniref:maleylpyruvate isomerase family mycothiol-dependent enzyme n=1 Tax=Modestobacter marinus TaxID=477641 RepID=UPI001C9727E5|nr:maleylpyruvate isomerase family mycothiol-dependent enzyme [Modestobacter marinus]
MGTDRPARRTTAARASTLDRGTATSLAATEYERVAMLFESLTPLQWRLPTECPGWDVRAMAGHMLGMAQMVATVPAMVRQQMSAGRAAKRTGTPSIDCLTRLQVEQNARLSTTELTQQMRVVGPRAVRGRRRMSGVLGRRTLPELQTVGDQQEWWTFGYLFDVVLTRDPFMHRIDISRATGVPLDATADHEGVLVDDVVREWTTRHGRRVRVELSGPAGGRWGDPDGELLTMDALEFCRTLSGREAATGPLAQQVPF